jgi:hypothetical protein
MAPALLLTLSLTCHIQGRSGARNSSRVILEQRKFVLLPGKSVRLFVFLLAV